MTSSMATAKERGKLQGNKATNKERMFHWRTKDVIEEEQFLHVAYHEQHLSCADWCSSTRTKNTTFSITIQPKR